MKIVVPIYKNTLNGTEALSLNRLKKVMGRYDIVFIKPESLDISALRTVYDWPVESFPDDFFRSIRDYSRLMLSSEVYERFIDEDYLLVHQSDAYIFTDNICDWISKGYDYVGAPWIPAAHRFYLEPDRHKFMLFIDVHTPGFLHHKNRHLVGNGGLSLRRTAKMIEITRRYKTQIATLLRRGEPEDLILGGLLSKLTGCKINTPGYHEALEFAFEMHIPTLLKITDNVLPMGCHAWDRKPYAKQWSKIFDFKTGTILDPGVRFRGE